MVFWSWNLFLAFFISVIFAGILIPKILLISFRKKLFDGHDERKIHRGVVPRLGGIAFKPVLIFSMALLLGINYATGNTFMLEEFQVSIVEFLLGICALILLYLVGMADDLIGVRYSAKFVVQIFCGILLVASGLYISDWHGVFGMHVMPSFVGMAFTILLVVFIINAINLIDGIDGLASGLSGVALLYYGFIFAYTGGYAYSLLAFATLGTLVPFFYFNVFGNPDRGRKIFMGDTGALTIGFILCFLSIKLSLLPATQLGDGNPLVIGFAPLIVPCFDVVRVFIHRVRAGNNPFKPDRNHIHHKLLALGMNQSWAMILILLISLSLMVANFFLSFVVNINILLFADILAWTLFNMWLTSRISKCRPAGR